MASSSSNSRSRSENAAAVLCFHREIATLRTVRFVGPTQGRRFYGCSHYPRTCGFFRWADGVDDELELQNRCFEKDTIVAKLEMQNEELARTVKEQKQEIKQLTDERDELAMEVSETILSISSAKADRKFAMALILSWVFFSFALLIK